MIEKIVLDGKTYDLSNVSQDIINAVKLYQFISAEAKVTLEALMMAENVHKRNLLALNSIRSQLKEELERTSI